MADGDNGGERIVTPLLLVLVLELVGDDADAAATDGGGGLDAVVEVDAVDSLARASWLLPCCC